LCYAGHLNKRGEQRECRHRKKVGISTHFHLFPPRSTRGYGCLAPVSDGASVPISCPGAWRAKVLQMPLLPLTFGEAEVPQVALGSRMAEKTLKIPGNPVPCTKRSGKSLL
jgi:hypothetical protein